MLSLVFRNLLLAGLFFLAGRLGLSLGFSHQNVTPIWPPSGLALVALWLYGLRLLPGVLLGGSLLTYSTGVPLSAALIAGIANTAEAYAGYFFLARYRFESSLQQLRDVLLLLGIALFTPIVGATIGTFGLSINGLIAPGEYLKLWMVWWVGDVVGLYLVAPFLFIWSKPTLPFRHFPLLRVLEVPILLIGLVAVSRVVFSEPHGMAYAVFPFLIWAALRYLQPGATLATIVLSALTITQTIVGEGPFAFGSTEERLIQLQFFLGVAAATAYVLAAGASERIRNETIRLNNAALDAARREAEAGQQRFAFLAEASRVLSESLDYQTTLRNLVGLAVPHLADYAIAVGAYEDGTLRNIEVFHPQPAQQQILRTKLRQEQQADPSHPIRRAAETGEVLLTREIGGTLGENEEHLIVPLVDLEGMRIVICLTFGISGRHFTPADTALAQELQTRANIAVENARLYQKAQEAVEIRNRFLSVAAHELKTPVTGILGFAQFARKQLARTPPDREKAAHATGIVEQQAKKLSSLIDQLLDVARIQSGKLQPSPHPIRLRELVTSLVEQMQGEFDGREIRLRGEDVQMMADPLRLEQVLINLLTNANKFTPAGSPIDIEIAANEEVTIAVRDYGPGIPNEEIPYVFDRFFQGKVAEAKGMGLGLYISREIVEMHGGRITVETPPDGGSRFLLTFPAAAQG
jgi:signal transduction histidine kinase/integral membrane sensor domain MASE1